MLMMIPSSSTPVFNAVQNQGRQLPCVTFVPVLRRLDSLLLLGVLLLCGHPNGFDGSGGGGCVKAETTTVACINCLSPTARALVHRITHHQHVHDPLPHDDDDDDDGGRQSYSLPTPLMMFPHHSVVGGGPTFVPKATRGSYNFVAPSFQQQQQHHHHKIGILRAMDSSNEEVDETTTPTENQKNENSDQTAEPTSKENDNNEEQEDNGNTESSKKPVSAIMIATIGIYKNFISPLLPPACRFVPTCSQYGVQAIEQFGPSKGVVLTAWRLLRCSPVGGSGYDPPKWPPVAYNYKGNWFD